MPKRKLSDELRAAVDASGMSRYRICKDLSLDERTMSRFMARERGLRLETVDELAEKLGMRLVKVQPKGRR